MIMKHCVLPFFDFFEVHQQFASIIDVSLIGQASTTARSPAATMKTNAFILQSDE